MHDCTSMLLLLFSLTFCADFMVSLTSFYYCCCYTLRFLSVLQQHVLLVQFSVYCSCLFKKNGRFLFTVSQQLFK